ncbi:MAG: hypothetical protein A3F43_00680 [Gammaproteobacteria bacterium RIFCSPHIGHO2_12_FULL_42_10]|nr:MAG: hypothetical protein A3F43_00680 [Gammaproteobacteria bacterium RIFCSPHIGHO2_12_FULL_42_10]
MLQTYEANEWDNHFPDSTQKQAISALEEGQILYFPQLDFSLLAEEQQFLSPDYVDTKAKHVSYLSNHGKLWGVRHLTDQQHIQLQSMLERFARSSYRLIQNMLTPYTAHLIMGRTSFRPVEVAHRKTSYRKDDTRLHVDAFPSAPNQGMRILRVFSNINPHGKDRIWRIGESFEKVAEQFIPKINAPKLGTRALLRFLRITKSYRTLYDHYMLRMHHAMKADNRYQQQASQREVRFPSGSTWVVQTDHVSHASMQGQYALEQTFYLPVKAMFREELAPLSVLERMLQMKLS